MDANIHMDRSPLSEVLRFRIIGLCILAAFPLFGVGQALLNGQWHWLGLLMCLGNSAAVVLIGILMHTMITTSAPRTAQVYLVARITEGSLLCLSVMGIHGGFMGLAASADVFYQIGMVALGIGSLPMCVWLVRSTLAPAMLGGLGFAGYINLIAAMIALASGFATASMALLLPGALFEIAFGSLLLFNGRRLRVQDPHVPK